MGGWKAGSEQRKSYLIGLLQTRVGYNKNLYFFGSFLSPLMVLFFKLNVVVVGRAKTTFVDKVAFQFEIMHLDSMKRCWSLRVGSARNKG